MSKCNASEKHSCKRWSIISKNAYTNIERAKESNENRSGSKEHVRWMSIFLKKEHNQNRYGTNYNSHQESHPLPPISENKSSSISPEVDWKKDNKKSKKCEKYTRDHILFSTSYLISTKFPGSIRCSCSAHNPSDNNNIDTNNEKEWSN